MNRSPLRRLVCDWIVPGVIGLGGAAVLIAGAEIGGVIGWLFIGLAAAALVGVVVYAVRTIYTDDWINDAF